MNGTTSTNDKIKNIFQSVQLNINNPNFLIMQGKVTQVVKMKPKELLSLLEETTGTSLYEGKKKIAESTITKKDKKLEEIEVLIGPIREKIEKLQEDKKIQAEYRKMQEDLNKTNRILIAHEFYTRKQDVARADNETIQLTSKLDTATQENERLQIEFENVQAELDKCKGSFNEELIKKEKAAKDEYNLTLKECNKNAAETNSKQKEVEQIIEEQKQKKEEIEETNRAKDIKTKEREVLKTKIAMQGTQATEKEKYAMELEGKMSTVKKGGDVLEPIQQRMDHLNTVIEKAEVEITGKEKKCASIVSMMAELKERIKRGKEKLLGAENSKSQLEADLKDLELRIEKLEANESIKEKQRKSIEYNGLKAELEKTHEAYSNIQHNFNLDIKVLLFLIN